MKVNPRVTRAALELVTRFETFQPQAVAVAGGGWSVGYGHTRSAREGARVDRADAEALLLYDLRAAAEVVEAALFAPIGQRQFEALTAFCFNIGAENFRRSTALARFNAGAELEAADEIERWRHAELGAGAQVVDALVRRRAAEKAHFLGLPEGFSKSPSPLLRPLPNGGVAPEAVEPPPLEAPTDEPTPTSATLDAAYGIQARLRQLIPDADHASEPPEPIQPPAETLEPPPAETVAAPEPIDTAAAPDFIPPHPGPVANDVTPLAEPAPEPEPTPPPPPPSLAPPPPPPPMPTTPVAPPAPEPDVALTTAPAAGVVPPTVPLVSARTLHLVLIALGACLLIAAFVLILGGRPTLANLGLGIIGAVVMTPGVYGLLGARPASP